MIRYLPCRLVKRAGEYDPDDGLDPKYYGYTPTQLLLSGVETGADIRYRLEIHNSSGEMGWMYAGDIVAYSGKHWAATQDDNFKAEEVKRVSDAILKVIQNQMHNFGFIRWVVGEPKVVSGYQDSSFEVYAVREEGKDMYVAALEEKGKWRTI